VIGKRISFTWLLVGISLAFMLASGAESANNGIDITGTWVFDTTSVREYFTIGMRLQRDWCGYSWSSDELEARIRVGETPGTFPKLSFTKVDDHTYAKTIYPAPGQPETTRLSNCEVIADGRLRCDKPSRLFAARGLPDLDAEYFRRADHYLFIDIPVHKSMMQCPKGKELPDEVKWNTLRYIKPIN
jgi:hypothetical protein